MIAPGRSTSTAAAQTVSSEKKPTFTSASFSIRVYPPPTRTVIVIVRQTATQALTDTAGTSR